MQREATVTPGVQLVHVEVDGPEIAVDVFGGDDTVIVAEIVFRVDDPVDHHRASMTLKRWEYHATRLTLVQEEDGAVKLVDEDVDLDSALG